MRILVLAATAAFLLLDLAAPAPAALTSETLQLDTYGPSGTVSGPITTSVALTDGTFYLVQASGTFATYSKELLTNVFVPYVYGCGKTEIGPTVPSPGKTSTVVNADPEYVFAAAVSFPCTDTVTGPSGQFQLDAGTGFGHPAAIGGPYVAARADHTYSYLVRGGGVPLAALYTDQNRADNNGVITLSVRPATQAECGEIGECRQNAAPTVAVAPAQTTRSEAAFSRTCLSTRRFEVRVKAPAQDRLAAATVTVRGRSYAARRRKGRFSAVIALRGRRLPAVYRVSVVARTRSGKLLTGTKRFTACRTRARGTR